MEEVDYIYLPNIKTLFFFLIIIDFSVNLYYGEQKEGEEEGGTETDGEGQGHQVEVQGDGLAPVGQDLDCEGQTNSLIKHLYILTPLYVYYYQLSILN